MEVSHDRDGAYGGQPSPMWLHRLGAQVLRQWIDARGAFLLLGEVVRSLGRLERRQVVHEIYLMANGSWLFVTAIMSFVGAIMVIQAAAQAQRLVGDLSAIGPAFLQLLVREFGPTIVGLMVAARYGAGVSARLATMTITEQVDALRMSGAHPATFLVAPRVVAGGLGMITLTIWGAATAYVVGGLAAYYGFGVGWGTYFSTVLVRRDDVIVGVVKALCYGVVVPLWACRAGLQARGGPPGVGRATTRAVIGASVGVLLFDLLIGTVGFLLFT